MNRITLLASLCQGSNIVIDVGCDHGYVLIEAIKNYGVIHGIASDVAVGPLESAKKNISLNGLNDKIETVISDGLKEISNEFDTVVIAGMGGSLISDILSNSLDKIKNKKLILQPNNDRYKVRKLLTEMGFIFTSEHSIIDSNKYYEIMVCKSGNQQYSDFELKYGPCLLKNKNDAFIKHYSDKLEYMEGFVEKMDNSEAKKEKILEINEIKEVLK